MTNLEIGLTVFLALVIIYSGVATWKIWSMYNDVDVLHSINNELGEMSVEMIEEIEDLQRQAKISEDLLDEYRKGVK